MTLALEAVTCAYGAARVVYDVSLTLSPGEILCLMGRNGAGKTTTLKAVMGLVKPASGRIRLDDQDLTGLRPHEIPRLGVAYVPQGRGVFPSLSVEENLRMGLLVRGSRRAIPPWVFELFPVLRDRLRQQAGTLSGGEQQMLATARALCAEPGYLLMDEPTEGLMPALVRSLLGVIQFLKARGVGILLVEQKVDAALQVADRVVLMEAGRVRYQGTPADVAAAPEVLVRYLGVRRAAS
ncbi:MAG: ABC transporter ATP-binding protein [Armatimonadota bacterium]|nr:ABC transporter ATP-binding protein [Armatimonadota bacterium]MDR7548311.1 ABC transporter ATP-binding protein [Armatimonadota bacterium]